MCTLNPPCVIRPSSNWPQLEWDGPAVGKKAASRPSEHRIWVEKKFWDSIAQLAARPAIAARQRLALVCHEKGARSARTPAVGRSTASWVSRTTTLPSSCS